MDRHLCGHAEIQSYTGAVELVPPAHMKREDGRGICVDVCLALEITKLWAEGITTTGCCCGHGLHPAYIGVIEADIPRMKALSYDVAPNPMRPDDEDSFVPKTVLTASPSPSEMEVVANLRSDAAQLLRMSKATAFGEDLSVRVTKPDLLIANMIAAADAIGSLSAQVLHLTEENAR